MTAETSLDRRNAAFWDELCGTNLAREVGATGRTPADLERFDAAYLDFYPYLSGYLPEGDLSAQRVLEIGLGYGTLGQVLVDRGAEYVGVDLAPGPVDMMRYRIALRGNPACAAALRGSALALPIGPGSCDLVCSIGCLHHTGDLRRAVSEVRRVLRPGGRALVMLYNRRSLRRVAISAKQGMARRLRRHSRPDPGADVRALYDLDQDGNVAPHTDFVSITDIERLFDGFRSVLVERRNLSSGRLPIPRSWLLASRLDRLVGLDLYVQATA